MCVCVWVCVCVCERASRDVCVFVQQRQKTCIPFREECWGFSVNLNDVEIWDLREWTFRWSVRIPLYPVFTVLVRFLSAAGWEWGSPGEITSRLKMAGFWQGCLYVWSEGHTHPCTRLPVEAKREPTWPRVTHTALAVNWSVCVRVSVRLHVCVCFPCGCVSCIYLTGVKDSVYSGWP